MHFRGALLTGFLLLLAARPAAGQEIGGSPPEPNRWPVDVETAPRPVARATRITEPVRIDGQLDEAVWQEADSITEFVQSQPRTGYPATEPTVVRIVYDDRALYIGAELYDSRPEELIVSTLEKDFPGESTRDVDIFAVTLDTFHDRKNSFIYLINPYGALRDGQTFDDSRDVNFSWDGVVELETRIHDRGWTVEMAIPWNSLRFDPNQADGSWGLNLLRRVRRKNEDSYWAPVDRRDPVHRMSRAGTLTGFEGLRASRNLTITPYALAGNTYGRLDAANAKHENEFDAGADLKYGITPKLTLDLTYRTDFSQIEVDQEQVNLTRFGLFFPEKRDFFVENSGVFTFGDVSEREYRMGSTIRDFTLFHSRRIGLRNGRPVPIIGGGRVTGRLAGWELGLLDMQTESAYGEPQENFAVARMRRSFFGNTDVGVLFTNRQATDGGGGFNRSYGVDASAHLLGNLILHSYVAATDKPGPDPNNLAARVAAGWRDRLWDVSAFVKQVGDDFDPGIGFVRRRGVRHAYGTVGVHPQRPFPGVQELNPYAEVHYVTGEASLLETRTGTLGTAVQFGDGSTLGLEFNDRFERIFEPFRVGSSDTVPIGAYEFRDGTIGYESSAGRAISGALRIGGGGYFGGSRQSVGLAGLWRASPHLSVDLSVDHNRVRLADDAFTADVLGGRISYAQSTRLFGSAFVQYNAAEEQLVSNLRVNFIHAPLSDLFLVYTERRDMAAGAVVERLLTAKVTKLVAF